MLGKRVLKDGGMGCGPVGRYWMVCASLLLLGLKSTERWGGREARIGAQTRKGSTQGGELGRAEMRRDLCLGILGEVSSCSQL